MSRGSIQRRGRHSWRIKVDLPSTNSGRQTRHLTVRGTRRDAERELARLVNAAHDGSLVEPSKLTVGAYLQAWLANPHGLANKTVTRYRQLAHYQIIPHLGMVPLQQLRPAHIVDWHAKLLAGGGVGGRALSARSVLHAHCLLHHALERALRSEIITRNVAHAVRPPRIETREIQILKADEIAAVLTALVDHPLYPLVVVALSSGARRGELMGLQWGDVDFASGSIKIERSLEQAGGTLQCKPARRAHNCAASSRSRGAEGPSPQDTGAPIAARAGQAGRGHLRVHHVRRRPDQTRQFESLVGRYGAITEAAGSQLSCAAAFPRQRTDRGRS